MNFGGLRTSNDGYVVLEVIADFTGPQLPQGIGPDLGNITPKRNRSF